MTHDSSQWLSTAVEAVLHAGEMQMARFGQGIRIDKKGAIDLVTEVDVAVETWFRAFIHDRFPDHRILAEELQEGPPAGRPDSPYCWIFDPIDGTTNYAHGLPIFCASLALEIDGRIEVGAVFDPTRKELFTAQRGHGAFLNGTRLHVSNASPLRDALLCTGFPYDVYLVRRRGGRAVRALRRGGPRGAAPGLGRARSLLRRRRAARRLLGGTPPSLGHGGGRAARRGGGRHDQRLRRSAFHARRDDIVASNGVLHPAMLEVIARYQAAYRPGVL